MKNDASILLKVKVYCNLITDVKVCTIAFIHIHDVNITLQFFCRMKFQAQSVLKFSTFVTQSSSLRPYRILRSLLAQTVAMKRIPMPQIFRYLKI